MNHDLFITYWRLAHAVDVKIPYVLRLQLRQDIKRAYAIQPTLTVETEHAPSSNFSVTTLLEDLRTALAAWQELSLGRHAVQAILLRRVVAMNNTPHDEIAKRYDEKTANLIDDLNHVYSLRTDYAKGASETFSRLMVAVAKDVRVIMMLIARHLVVMRNLQPPVQTEHAPSLTNSLFDSEEKLLPVQTEHAPSLTNPSPSYAIAQEALQLYAPLAHRMGLYAVKTELEDLGLKYTEYDTYKDIARKLNAKKRERDAYISKFIEPIQKKVQEHWKEISGEEWQPPVQTEHAPSLPNFVDRQKQMEEPVQTEHAPSLPNSVDRQKQMEEPVQTEHAPSLPNTNSPLQIKGRTKSIYSIWRKMQKQGCDVDGVYDLFAIRIVIDIDREHAKSACWQVYAIVADMYVPNTKRLRDWITVPKSNGYESLHTTVMGPEGKWVEVQIRTKDMDEVAEKGVAAHWKYKGIKSDGAQSEEWLRQLREVLEQGGADSDSSEAQQRFKMELYDDDVFVFTPQGELKQMPRGSTVLDFAFSIHSRIGETAVGAKVNGRHVQIGYKLANGDQIEIITSANQKPKADWLNLVVTAKARQRIRQKLQEMEFREAELGREIVERKFRNWKIEVLDSDLDRAARKFGYETLRKFFVAVNQEKIDLLDVREWILAEDSVETEHAPSPHITVKNYTPQTGGTGAVVIDGGVQGLDYELSRCCNPVYGDEIFGFVGAHGGIKIHRKDCPNARDLMERMQDRMVQVHWATDNDSSAEYIVNIRVIGNDDIGILNNITSIISKESNINMRNLSVSSEDGLFEGNVSLIVRDVKQVDQLLKKLRTVKGVKQVVRL